MNIYIIYYILLILPLIINDNIFIHSSVENLRRYGLKNVLNNQNNQTNIYIKGVQKTGTTRMVTMVKFFERLGKSKKNIVYSPKHNIYCHAEDCEKKITLFPTTGKHYHDYFSNKICDDSFIIYTMRDPRSLLISKYYWQRKDQQNITITDYIQKNYWMVTALNDFACHQLHSKCSFPLIYETFWDDFEVNINALKHILGIKAKINLVELKENLLKGKGTVLSNGAIKYNEEKTNEFCEIMDKEILDRIYKLIGKQGSCIADYLTLNKCN